MAIDPNKEVFMFMAQYAYQDTIVDDGTYDDDEDDDEDTEDDGSESEEGA